MIIYNSVRTDKSFITERESSRKRPLQNCTQTLSLDNIHFLESLGFIVHDEYFKRRRSTNIR